MKPELSVERLEELFSYEDGKLISKKKIKGRNVGDVLGSVGSKGYLTVRVDGVNYLLHRVIFMMKHGYLPKFLDHIDGDILNNKVENLRAATNTENQWNQKIRVGNKSGYKGVNWDNTRSKWRANCKVNGKAHNLGYFNNPEQAARVVQEFRNNNHKEFARHG